MIDIQAIKAEYDRLCVLSQTDNVGAANQAVVHYAQTMPFLIDEVIRLQSTQADALPHLTSADDVCIIQ